MVTLAILFSTGALGDCARHAILHAMKDSRVDKIRVYSSDLTPLDEANWKCGCGVNHGEEMRASPNFSKVEMNEMDVTDPADVESKLDLSGATAVISGLGNRQMFLGDRVGKQGMENIVKQMKKCNGNADRLVAMSSIGINEDYPCLEWRWEGKIMDLLFMTFSRREYHDITGLENVAKASGLNFLLVRPVGLGEEVKPAEEYFIQQKKGDDALGANMAKSDVGLFLVEQAVAPTYEKTAVVIGADPADAFKSFS